MSRRGADVGAILMYHRIASLQPDVFHLCATPDRFREHMRALRDRYAPKSLAAVGDHAGGDTLPGAVAVTLDDGYLDNLTVASAILQELEVPATFFITTERLSERHELWWDSLERILLSELRVPERLNLEGLGADTYRTATSTERRVTCVELAERLRSLAPEARNRFMTAITAWAGVELSPRDTHRVMTAEEVRELSSKSGHALGAHSVHHVSLSSLSIDIQRQEMTESRQTLEELSGTRVSSFAYPYGHANETTRRLATEIFELAVGVAPGGVSTGANRFDLPRIDASVLSTADLTARLDSLLA